VAVEGDGSVGDAVLRVTGDGVGQGRLSGAVGAHDGVRLAGADGEVDASQDLLVGAVLDLDGDVEVADLKGGHRFLRSPHVGGDGDEHVVAVDLHGVDGDRDGRRGAGRVTGSDIEPGAVQPALEG